MFELVPEPVWKTSIGNWSSKLCRRCVAAAAALGLVGVEQPELRVRARGSRLDAAEPARDGNGIGSPETGSWPPPCGSRRPELRCSAVSLTAARLAAAVYTAVMWMRRASGGLSRSARRVGSLNSSAGAQPT